MEQNKYEKYEIIDLHRSQIKNAPYNPRKITDEAKQKLKDNIKTIGLLSPITWNIRTGNIVSGHQRITVLDSLHGTKDYTLKVARVDLDEKTEKQQNIFMNNPEAMGDFDLEKLEDLIKIDQIDIDATGFTPADIYQLLGDNPIIEQPEQLVELSNSLREAQERYKDILTKTSKRDAPTSTSS